MHVSARSLLSESLGDLRRAWPQLVITDVMARVLAVVLIAPAVGLLIKLFLWRTATGVLTDEAIASFLLHPFGLAALVVVAAVSLGMLFAETGQLMVIGFAAVEDRRVTWFDALVYTFRRVVALVHLAGSAVVRLLLIAAPFLAATGVLYWLLVRTHDINYYLARRPPEFTAAVLGAGILVAAFALIVVWKIAGWLLALPLVLFEGADGRESLAASVSVTRPIRWKIVAWLVGWLAATAVASAVMTRLIGFVGRVAVSRLEGDINWLLVCLSAIIIVGGLANLALSVVTTVFFPLLVVRFYRAAAGPGALFPEIAPAGSLGRRPPFRVRGIFVLAAGIVAVTAVVVGIALAVDDPDWEDPTQIIAHRGGAWAAPENTLAAFERGIADGADWLELDVQEIADGTVVVEHDRDFMRVAGVPLEVWQATEADLADLDIGKNFAPEFAGQRVPTLREVLELARGKAGVFVELKYYGHDVNLEQKVVDLIEETKMADQIVIMSLKYEGVRKVAELRPDWTIGLLNAVAVGDLTRLDVDFLALTANTTSRRMVWRIHKRGMQVYPWTVNDPVQMWVMMSRGVDGIITDRVALANRVKELRADLTPTGRFVIWMAAETGLLRGIDKKSTEEDA
jgi:glycerophosphoryl diester phosphodiesterase